MSQYSWNDTSKYLISQLIQSLQTHDTNILFKSDVLMRDIQRPAVEYLDSVCPPENRINMRLTNWNKGGVTVPFPERLHELLAEEKFSEIVSWAPHGRAFRVINSLKFEKEVIPNYFDQTKFRSFQRQLNLYGFNRIKRGPDKGCYYHELFLRGQKQICKLMRRLKPAKCQPAQEYSDPVPEPNFYSMPQMNDDNALIQLKDDSALRV